MQTVTGNQHFDPLVGRGVPDSLGSITHSRRGETDRKDRGCRDLKEPRDWKLQDGTALFVKLYLWVSRAQTPRAEGLGRQPGRHDKNPAGPWQGHWLEAPCPVPWRSRLGTRRRVCSFPDLHAVLSTLGSQPGSQNMRPEHFRASQEK